MFIYCFCGNKDTYLVSLFANAQALIIAGVLIINLMSRMSVH